MKRYIVLIVVGVALIIIGGARGAGAHSAYIRCEGNLLHYHADSYGNGRYTIDGGTSTAFEGGFDFYRPGDHVGRLTITAPDWPTFDATAGPCISTTTTVRSTPSTSTSPSTTAVAATTSVSATTAPSTTASSPSTTPPTTPPSSTSAAPSTTAGPTSTTPGLSPTSTTSTSAPGANTPPAVPALPVTGASGTLTLAAFATIGAGGICIAAGRRKRA